MNELLLSYQYKVEDYITFSINVISGNFSGESNFCISTDVLHNGITELQRMYEILAGSYTFRDYDSDDYIEICVDKYGKVLIKGQVGGSHRNQYLVYEMETDQTDLKNVIKKLKDLRKAE